MAATVGPGLSSSLRPVVDRDISSPEPPRFEAQGARTGSRDHSGRGLQATRTKLDRETIFQCLPVQSATGSPLWPPLQQDPSWLRCRQGNLGFLSLTSSLGLWRLSSWGRTESHKGCVSSLKPNAQQTELGTPCSMAHLPGIAHSHGVCISIFTVLRRKLRLKRDWVIPVYLARKKLQSICCLHHFKVTPLPSSVAEYFLVLCFIHLSSTFITF